MQREKIGTHVNKKKNRIIGIVLCVIQMIVSIALLTQASVIPGKYLAIAIVALFVMFGVTFTMQFSAKKALGITGKVISILMSIVLLIGTLGLYKVNHFFDAIGSEGLKVDNMIAVVRVDDPAQSIVDAKDYTFGIQETLDRGNTLKMCQEINGILDKSIHKKDYESLDLMANALLSGETDAAIYNKAYTDIIEDSIEGYSDKVKVIYQFGIETKIEEKEVEAEKGFNIYISGIDVAGPIESTSRSDVNIIMSVNPTTKKILLTTTPRDYYVPIPDISGGANDKLTHAGIYGVDASIRTLEQLYGIEISYYAKVNFSSLIKIVDLLGGVDVYSDYTFSTGQYSFNEGWNTLNGDQALAFSRERYSFDSGDNQRGKNQEAVIEGILKKAMTPAVLNKAGTIIEQISGSIETNMGVDKMKQLVNMQLADNATWEINSQAAVGQGDYNSCYSSGSQLLYVMYPDESSVSACAALMNSVVDGE